MGGQVELFDDTQVYDAAFENPMVVLYGKGPEKKCKTCSHFLRLDYHDKQYRKCEIRGITHGPGTDHRANDHACAKYEKEV